MQSNTWNNCLLAAGVTMYVCVYVSYISLCVCLCVCVLCMCVPAFIVCMCVRTHAHNKYIQYNYSVNTQEFGR